MYLIGDVAGTFPNKVVLGPGISNIAVSKLRSKTAEPKQRPRPKTYENNLKSIKNELTYITAIRNKARNGQIVPKITKDRDQETARILQKLVSQGYKEFNLKNKTYEELSLILEMSQK